MKYTFLFLLIITGQLWAASAELYYLKADSVDLSEVTPPPVLNSAEDLADLAEVLRIQGVRSENDCKRAGIEAEGFATSFFGGAYGPFTDAEAQKLVDFQERLFKEVNYFSKILKTKYERVRPYIRDPRIVPCIKIEKSNSYPSGHSAISYVAASAFAVVYPEIADAIMKRSEEIAFDRVVGGVHHPLDTIAGRDLGKRVFEALMKQENFRKDLMELRQ